MGKGSKKKRPPADLALAEIPRREKKSRGRARMAEISRENAMSAQSSNLIARVRQMGKPATEANLVAARNQALGEPAGQAIYLLADNKATKARAAKLWAVYAAWTASCTRYWRLALQMSPHSKCAKIEMAPERMETRDDFTPDLRSEDEKVNAATSAYMSWEGRLGQLSAMDRAALWDVALGRQSPLRLGKFSQAEMTIRGEMFLSALSKLADIVEAEHKGLAR